MRAGLLNELIDIQRSTKTRDLFGMDRETWESFKIVKAQVRYMTGTKSVDVQEVFYGQTVEFTIRYYVDVLPTDRIVYANQDYRILSINPNRQNNSKIIVTELINE